jgi:ABC-type lipoprotein release transport system permease subunit
MGRLKKWAWGSRKRRVVASILALLLLGASAGIAALIIYSGTSGSGSGTFENSSTVDAITITGTTNPVLVVGAAPVAFPVTLQNNDPNVQKAIEKSTFQAVFSSPVAGCASHLAASGAYLTDAQGSGFYSLLGPGGSAGMPTKIMVAADATTPLACAGAGWTLTFSGGTVSS